MNTSMRARIQAFGGFLTAMVIPNMGAFIGWGFITALFIDTGWMPNADFAKLVSPISTFVLPLLLAYTGGKLVAGTRGGVIGTFVTSGLIVGAEIPMFLGAMIMGPLSAYVIKKFDRLIEDKIPAGFEMVTNNFSLGIISLLLALLSYTVVGPLILQANNVITILIQSIVNTGFLPLLSLINEPAKVLFLNNVIDQGIYYPLGMQQALDAGKSIFFMVASSPGPGLGLLLAYTLFGKREAKNTAPGAIIIHFFGGIHEIYFPYVLMRPITIVGMILGAASGIFTFNLFNVGLVAGPSPGSIFSYLALTPRGNFIGVIAGVLVGTLVSFLINSVFVRTMKEPTSADLEKTKQRSQAMKKEGKDLLKERMDGEHATKKEDVSFIIFACDAGLGSSALGATSFKKRLHAVGLTTIEVKNAAIEKVPASADLIVTHEGLLERAMKANPDKRIVTIKNFMKDENLDTLFEELNQ